MAQLILEIVLFACILFFAIPLILLVLREKFLHAHVYLCCLSIWILLTLFSIIPIILQQYTSIIRLMGIVTFAIITIHTTLPVSRPWTILMALITSSIHLILVIRTHYLRDWKNKAHQMEFKLEVNPQLSVSLLGSINDCLFVLVLDHLSFIVFYCV